MLTVIRIFEDNNIMHALLRRDLRCTLEGQMVTARLEMDDDACEFPLAREGDHLPSRITRKIALVERVPSKQ